MSIKSFDHTSPYFFTQQIHDQDAGNLLALARSDPELQRKKGVLKNILRWEDDGGKIIEVDHSKLDEKRRKNNE